MTKAKFIKFIIASVLAIAALFLPYESLGFDAASPMGILNPLEIRVIGVFVMAALFWILQPFPIWSTSVLVIVLMIVTMSDSSLAPFRVDGVTMISHKSIMATFANPIIMLFLGGFFLAAAATKYKMDLNLARVLLKPFGKNPKFVLLGLMLITAVFSMFMSNTATAAMMLAILAPVLKLFDEDDRGKAAFALAIPLGANIGGMGTPIGTPPNAIALGALNDAVARGDLVANPVTFGQWMAFGIPYVIILMVVAWLLLVKIYPIKMKQMVLNIEGAGKFDTSPKAIIVYITFVVCVLLWVTGKNVHGINDNAIAMIPMAVFALTGVITKKDLNAMSWDVLWLVAGGFALGVGLNATGLAAHLIKTIPFASWSPLALMIGCGIICLFMANFMSHTSTATLLVPILCAVGIACQDNLVGLGGVTALLVSVAFASSLGMSLPISTPPNALAHATGYTDTRGMAITGIVMGLVGLVLSWVMMIFLAKVNFFGTPVPKAADAAPAAPVAAEKVVEAPAPAPEAPVAVVADSSVIDSAVTDTAAVDSAATDTAAVADSTAKDSAVVDSAAAAQAAADSLAAKAAADSAAAAQAAADSAAAAQAKADSIEKVKAAEAAALVAAAEAKKARQDSIAAAKKAKADSVAAAKKAAAEAKKAAAAAKKAQQDSIAAVKKAKSDSVAAAKKAAAEAKKAEAAKKKAEAEEAKKKAAEEKKAAAAAKKAQQDSIAAVKKAKADSVAAAKKAAAEAKKAEAAKKKAEAEEAKKKAAEEKKAAAAAKKAQQDSIAAVKKAKADSVAAAKKAAAEAKKAEDAKKKAEAEEAKKKAAEEKKKAAEAKKAEAEKKKAEAEAAKKKAEEEKKAAAAAKKAQQDSIAAVKKAKADSVAAAKKAAAEAKKAEEAKKKAEEAAAKKAEAEAKKAEAEAKKAEAEAKKAEAEAAKAEAEAKKAQAEAQKAAAPAAKPAEAPKAAPEAKPAAKPAAQPAAAKPAAAPAKK
jgi:sodium-dependent dicarboxylate transporter 2/3/5